MTAISRFTSEFVDLEDRVRLSSEVVDGRVVSVWLTQRLLNRLVPHLAGLLEKETQNTPRGEVLQAFAQQAAVTSHAQQATGQAGVIPALSTEQWLVRAVDVNAGGEAVALKFRGESVKQEVDVAMSQVQLRQWLGILRSQYVKAGWDVTSWPDWLGESSVASPQIGSVTIH